MEIIIAIGALVIIYLLLTRGESAQNIQKSKKVTAENHLLTPLTEIDTSLLLEKGEAAYFEITSTLSETRAERRHQSIFAGKRNKNSTFFGGSTGRSKSHQVLTVIDSGRLILTNKRLAFDGNKTNRNIKLDKLMSITIVSNFFSSDQIEISIEGRQKSMYFSTPNTQKYRKLIMLARQQS